MRAWPIVGHQVANRATGEENWREDDEDETEEDVNRARNDDEGADDPHSLSSYRTDVVVDYRPLEVAGAIKCCVSLNSGRLNSAITSVA